MHLRLVIRPLITLLVFLPFFLHLRGDWHFSWLDRLENMGYDLKVLLTMPQTVDDRIVIVDIDERSMLEEGQWPWPRDKVARLVDKLFDHYEVGVLGFDIVFAEPDLGGGLEVLEELAAGPLAEDGDFNRELERIRPSLMRDDIFASSLQDRPVALGFVFRRQGDSGADILTGALAPPIISAQNQDTAIPFHEAVSYTGNLPILQRRARGAGFIENPNVDSDGIYRRVPMLQSYRGDLYESLALAVTRLALGEDSVGFEFFSGPEGARDGLDLEALRLGDYRVPVDGQTSVLVPYRGRLGSFPYVSATDVLRGNAPRYPLKDAIVLIGTSAPGLHDLRTTPVGERYTGVEIHANIVSGILEQRLKYQPLYVVGIEFVLLVVVGIVMTAVLAWAPVLLGALVTLLVGLALFAGSLWAWNAVGLVVPFVTLEVYTALLFLLHTVYGYFVEARGYRALSVLFGQYVPPELVRDMARNPARVGMVSDSREMTVLFTDIRGFTSISETLAPIELSRLMNQFLTPMTRVIHRNRGTIDKYMGDAIMAFWGAPLEDRGHARHALQAAFEMQRELASLMPVFAEQGWPPIQVGVGINTGVMRVGNMGSQFRVAYTVMGDAVNMASRIESLTREYGVTIAVGEGSKAAVPEYTYLELDLVRVKGKDRPVAIFEPVGLTSGLSTEVQAMVRRHAQALELYRSGEWDDAEREFYLLHQTFTDRAIFKVYLDRIAHFRMIPPGPGWDGVFTRSVK